MSPARPTAAAARVSREPRPARRRLHAGWLPRQHGAWAMLVVPFAVGVLLGDSSLLHVPLFVCWLVGYGAFAAAGLWLRSRRKPMYLAPMLTYGAVSALAGLVVLVARPQVTWWLLVFAPLATISLRYSARRDDRALTNDVVTILAACLIAPVVADVATATPLWELGSWWIWVTGVLALYFVGTSLHVKTLIRERRSVGYRRASIAYHATATVLVAVVPALGLGPAFASPMHGALIAFFAVTTMRAAALAGRAVRPMHAGLGEIALSTMLLIILVVLRHQS